MPGGRHPWHEATDRWALCCEETGRWVHTPCVKSHGQCLGPLERYSMVQTEIKPTSAFFSSPGICQAGCLA